MTDRISLDELELMTPKELGKLLYNELDEELPDIEYIRDIIDAGAHVDFVDGLGYTPLHHLASRDMYDSDGKYEYILVSVKICELLIEAGASLEARTTDEDSTALHLAVRVKKFKLIKVLLAAGADLDARDEYGCTPLHYAVADHENYLVRSFLELGAPKDVKDNEGKTPWDLASISIKKYIPELNPSYND